MQFWELNLTLEEGVLDFALISTALILGLVLRRYVPFFQNFLIPVSLIAGFTGLILGPELIGLFEFSIDRMEAYLYHLLALTFICIGLQKKEGKRSRGAVHVGLMFLLSYMVQIVVGLSIALAIFYFFNPDLVPAIGTLLPLGFGMGPGIAASVGHSWSEYGVEGAGNVGLTMSAIGFLVAYFTGIAIVNRGIRQGKSSLLDEKNELGRDMRTGFIREAQPGSAGLLKFHGGAIEPLAFHMALVGVLYLITYLVTSGLEVGFRQIGLEQEVALLWSFHFIIANLLALGTGRLLDRMGGENLVDAGLNNRITGFLTDFMITVAIMAISLSTAWDYIVPILLICLTGAAATYFAIRWASQRSFEDYHFERFVGVYGEMTGTISSGLALIRVTDPELRTPVALDLGLGSGIALVLGFPLLIVINMPFTFFDGAVIGYWATMGASLLYTGIIFLLWKRFGFSWHKKATL